MPEPRVPAVRHPSVETLSARLSLRRERGNTAICLDGARIGALVSYGKPRPGQERSAFVPTVYGTRIYQPGLQIEEEAASPRSALGKVARAMSAALRAGTWTLPVPAAQELPAVADPAEAEAAPRGPGGP